MDTSHHVYRDIIQYLVERAMEYRFLVAPNPTVGACLLYENTIVAEGYHTHFGAPHAEIVCLEYAYQHGIVVEQCTLVVTLEPCMHHGKTPPCVYAILQSGIRRVVIGTVDPDAVASGSIALLQEHGIDVIVLEDSASLYCIQDFTMWKRYALPHVIVKLASTIDGYIATRAHNSKWITNDQTRHEMHGVRALLGRAHGAIMVGAGTVRYDNPTLCARNYGDIPQPKAIIVSEHLYGLTTSLLLRQRPQESIVITCEHAQRSEHYQAIVDTGASCIIAGKEKIDIIEALHILYDIYHIYYVFCEGGGMLSHSLIRLPYPIELWHCIAPYMFADPSAIPMVYGASPCKVEDSYLFILQRLRTVGDDIIAIYTK